MRGEYTATHEQAMEFLREVYYGRKGNKKSKPNPKPNRKRDKGKPKQAGK